MTQKSYCNNCGSSNTLEDSFCSECGAPLNQGKPTTGEAKTITNRRVNHSKPIKKIIGSICVGLLVVAAGITAVVIYHNEQTQSQETTAHEKFLSSQASQEKKQISSSLSDYKKLQNLAIDSVDKAFNTKSSADISSAQDVISKLRKSDQAALSQRLKNLTDQISKEDDQTISSSSSSSKTNPQTSSLLSGYSDDQIEFARVTEAIVAYYKYTYQPISISVTKNEANHQVLPFDSSIVIPQESVTLSFSSDNTMAGTTTITYTSNHNGSINFYHEPNHYQDDRYLSDPDWVRQQSQEMLNDMTTIVIPTSFDDKASLIISKIQIN